MNEIQIFNNPQFGEIRTAGTPEQPLFCLADVCNAIGIGNARNVKSRLDKDDVRLVDTIDSLGRTQMATFVNESGLYDVILRSDSEQAKPFRKWVTSEVLPAIRRTGQYSIREREQSDLPEKNASVQEVEASIKWIEYQRVSLGLGKSSTLQLLQKEGKRLGLPVASSVTFTRLTYSATELLKMLPVGKSAVQFNKAMMEYGFLEERKRGTGKKAKTCKMLTQRGLKYGENRIYPSGNGNGMVWPVYFHDTFWDLCYVIGLTNEPLPF